MRGTTMKETKIIEFKENINDSFLKTVSAFANFGEGKIYFGLNDNGEITGIKNLNKSSLQIEDKINDCIKPKPDYIIEKNEKQNIIILTIKEGTFKPYTYNNKIYKRNDTSTVAVSEIEHTRMMLKGMNVNYEDLESSKQNLTFNTLKEIIIPIKKIKNFNLDTLKTLNLYNEGKYNNAALLISDKNSFPGIDIVRFGDTINELLDRETYENCSVITEYNNSITMCKKYYEYEEIKNAKRITKEKLPIDAYREAVANAILHRVYDVNAKIRIEMYNDHIDIISPGGLPDGIKEEEYVNGKVSILRNPKLSNIFFQLKYTEQFATGIRRIHSCYAAYSVKPSFIITENSITVSLPTYDQIRPMSTNEEKIYNSINSNEQLSSSEISKRTNFSKPTCVRLLSKMIDKKLIKISGNGRGTKYQKI